MGTAPLEIPKEATIMAKVYCWCLMFGGGMILCAVTLAFPSLWPWSAEAWGIMLAGVVIGGLVTAPVMMLD